MRRDEPDLRESELGTVLGPLGTEVMRILWARGPSTVAEVARTLNGVGSRHLAYTTVMTILSRLYDRGLLERTQEGRSYRYQPVADEGASIDAIAGRAVDAVLDRYGAAAMRRFGERLGTLDPELRSELLRLAGGDDS